MLDLLNFYDAFQNQSSVDIATDVAATFSLKMSRIHLHLNMLHMVIIQF